MSGKYSMQATGPFARERRCGVARSFAKIPNALLRFLANRVSYLLALNSALTMRAWRNGRRAWFRSMWGQPRGGSTPLARTIKPSKAPNRELFCCPRANTHMRVFVELQVDVGESVVYLHTHLRILEHRKKRNLLGCVIAAVSLRTAVTRRVKAGRRPPRSGLALTRLIPSEGPKDRSRGIWPQLRWTRVTS